ncbi:MAG: type II toxin-antitoxin system prevent-host-death family antitoxin [Acidobacteriota bacterium]|nr:type II toxin-antitoxin system prevent-host-death family antitoxin [Acidobacteriota bacterium]
MTTVGIRVLKNRLSEYVRMAQSGERVTVTSRGAPVADLVPHAPHGLDPDDALLRLARAGEVRLAKRPNSAAVYTRPPKEERWPDDEVMALLDAVRGER